MSSAARSASVNDPQLVAGRNIFHRKDEDGDEWEAERVATDWPDERVHVVTEDVDGDVELLLTECEIPSLGTPHDIYYLGRFTICSRPDWESEVLRGDLYCPHTLQVADFHGDGHSDVYVAGSDYDDYENSRHSVYQHKGDGTFEEHLIREGTAVHEGKAADLTGDDKPDMVGKSNTIWQGDANSVCFRSLELTDSPAETLNVTGPETLSVRDLAERFANRFETDVTFEGEEQETALLNDASWSHDLYGEPKVSVDDIVELVASWVESERPNIDKPTKFHVRSGEF